jgi:hypothetical protein
MFAYYVGGKPLAEYVAGAPEVEINTDDRNVVEYGFARTVGQDYTWTIEDLRTLAHRLDCDRPVGVVDAVDWGRVEELHTQMYIMQGFAPPSQPELTESAGWRLDAEIAYMRGQMAGAVSSWARQDSPPSGTFELLAVADALASLGSDSALTYIESLRKWQPTEADMIQARLLESKGQLPEAATVLARALVSLRSDPWPFTNLILSAMRQAEQLAIRDPSTAQVLYDALKEPFGLYVHNESRMLQAVNVASHIDLSATIEAMRSFEPDVPWREDFLQRRADWYSADSRPAAERAVRDLEDFRSRQPVNILGSSPAPQ